MLHARSLVAGLCRSPASRLVCTSEGRTACAAVAERGGHGSRRTRAGRWNGQPAGRRGRSPPAPWRVCGDRPRSGHADLELRWLRPALALPDWKRELRAEYADAPVSLALYLGSYLVQATEDMPWTPAGVLHRRLLGWTREAELSSAVQQRGGARVPAEPSQEARQQVGSPAAMPATNVFGPRGSGC